MSAETVTPDAPVADLAEAHRYAEWALRKIRECEDAIARVKADQHAQLVEIETWADSEVRKYEGEIARVRLSAQPYADSLLAADPLKRRSVNLPSGSLGWRKGRESIVVENVDAATQWLADNYGLIGDLIRVKREVVIANVKARFKVRGERLVDDEGEILPGLRVHQGEETFYASTAPRPNETGYGLPR